MDKAMGFAADTAAGTTTDAKISAGGVTKCPIFALVTTLFSGSASPHPLGRGRHSTLPRFSSSPSMPISRACNAPLRHGMRTPRAEHIRGSHALYGPVLGYAWCMGGMGVCLSTWSAALLCCTHVRLSSSSRGSHRVRNQTGGIPPRASCPAASRFPARFSRRPAGA